MSKSTAVTESAAKPHVIILQKPIKRGDNEVTEITLREPTAGDLRGLKLLDVLHLDIDTISRLLPRISTPALIQQEVLSLGMVDFHGLCEEVALFFTPPEKRAD